MRPTFFKAVEAVRASYWFLPSVMALLAAGLGALMVWIDVHVGETWLNGISWYQSAKPDGAHQVLSTIAGSMITVAGVVFSITIVAIAYASSQYGPRLLTNFMGDRGNQVTLGTFIATFVYCLVVLRTIRGGDSGAFVPQLAVLVGLLLAFCSIAVLIYFIHHVTQSIHINHLAARIGRQLIELVEARFPEPVGNEGDGEEDGAEEVPVSPGPTACVAAQSTGYIQAVDEHALTIAASEADLYLRLRRRAGDFVHRGRALLEAFPTEPVEQAEQRLRAAFTIGSKRTPSGDLDFLIGELVEIAARALSTGVNDPATARTCVDWLGAGLSEVARRRMPQRCRTDGDGAVRVVTAPESFEAFLDEAFGALRQYVARDVSAALHMLHTLGEVAESCTTARRVDSVRAEVRRLGELAQVSLDGAGLDAVRRRADAIDRRLRGLR